MSEIRRPSDTLPIDRAELERLLEDARREASERDSAILRARPPPPPVPFETEEPITMVSCADCGGEYERVEERDGEPCVVTCAFCTRGGMSLEQLRRWHARREGRP